MKTEIELAKQAGWEYADDDRGFEPLWRFAELVRADEVKRADALAATIAGLRDIVTSDAESKVEFIARVRNVLGACPDLRVLHAVKAERDACAKVCDDLHPGLTTKRAAEIIRARGNT